MKVTYLDTKTGETAEQTGVSHFQLSENNWSCDCNRWFAFDLPDEEPDESGVCLGCHRFLVTKAELEETDDFTGPIDLLDFNREYPVELRHKHGLA